MSVRELDNAQGLTSLESDAIRLLLTGDHPALDTLRKQVVGATARYRDKSPCGWFTGLQIDDAAAPLPGKPRLVLSGVSSSFALPDEDFLGADFLLFVEDGRVDLLECAAFGTTFPASCDEEIRERLSFDETRELLFKKLEGIAHEP